MVYNVFIFCRCPTRNLVQRWQPTCSLMATTSQSPVRTENVCCCIWVVYAECIQRMTSLPLHASLQSLSLSTWTTCSTSPLKSSSVLFIMVFTLCVTPMLLQWVCYSVDFVTRRSQVDYDPSACAFLLYLQLFCSEEIEMLVCGCPEFDMRALESVTVYEEYNKTDTTIRYTKLVSCPKGVRARDYSTKHLVLQQTQVFLASNMNLL